MSYSSDAIRKTFDKIVDQEDALEKERYLRNAIPREFIKKYLKETDEVLDAGGGTGLNAIFMGRICRKVTLVDISPEILKQAEENIEQAGLGDRVKFVQGDITRLESFKAGQFSFIVCTGGVLSFLLEKAGEALRELVRVAQPGAVLVISCESRYGALRFYLGREGPAMLDEALAMQRSSVYEISECAKSRLFTVDELTGLLHEAGCEVLEMASTPVLIPWGNESQFANEEQWEQLKGLEMEVCTRPELLGTGYYLLCVAKKG